VGVVWGWVVVSFFMSFVALALAEICSSYPVRQRHPFVGDYYAGDLSFVSCSFSCSRRRDLPVSACKQTVAQLMERFHPEFDQGAMENLVLRVRTLVLDRSWNS
jgi:hypothetical protein